MRRIAIIGHKRTIQPITKALAQFQQQIEIVEVEFVVTERTDAAVEYIKALLPTLDGIIFTGKRPYEVINNFINISIPQVYIPHEQSILLQTILQASLKEGYDICSFSCDSYWREDIEKNLRNIGVLQEAMAFVIAPSYEIDENMLESLYQFHSGCIDRGEVTFSMTGVTMVHERMVESGRPCLLLQLTEEAINNGINQLWLSMDALENSESQIVVLSIEMDMPGEYNLILENEYQLMLEKAKVSEQVYKFAESVQAAVVGTGDKSFMLFSTKQMLEHATDQLNNMPLLGLISENSAYTVSIGIGYGNTAREAKVNASLGLNKALKQGGNQAYCLKNGSYSEPIKDMMKNLSDHAPIADPLYSVISGATGISINNIYKLQCIKEKMKKDCFTSAELANEFGNTRRSMNRILEKLERAGYAEVEGTRMLSQSGRPSRIIRLKL